MKRNTLTVLLTAILLLCFRLSATAQTDVTSLYLSNAGFDVEGDFVSSVVYTYANDANKHGGVSSCQPVTAWTADATGDAKAGGAFAFGSGYGLSGTSYVVPATDADGNSAGGALGLAACWTNSVGYSQAVSLPKGFYRLSFQVYNAGDNTPANYTSAMGFISDDGTSHYAEAYFPGGEWTEAVVYLNLPTATSGKIHLGYSCANVGSAATPKLFVDYVKIEQLPLSYTIGDVNDDSTITIADVTALVNVILGKDSNRKDHLADVNDDGAVTIADVTALVNIILGKTEAKVVDLSWTYADLDAMVFAQQSAAENATGPDYILGRAVGMLTGDDVSAHYHMADHLTTLHITTSLTNVASVSVYALGKENIAGPMTISCQGHELSYGYPAGDASTYANSLQSDVVSVVADDAGTYTAYLRPVSLPRGVKVTVSTTDGRYYSQDFPTISAGQANTLAFTAATAQNLWQSTIPGNTYFSMLSTPGAHDAATSSVTSYTSSAKCQSEDLAGLLANGVRAFDLRPRYTSNTQSDIQLDNLTIYHGMVSTGIKFKDAIDILIDFVKNNPSEAVSVIMNKENSSALFSLTDQSETWRASIRECFSDASRSPYLMGSVRGYHTLDDVRGKVSVVSRNPYGNSSNSYRDVVYGAIIENWPDDGVVTDYSCDMTQAWNWVDCRASVEDAYNNSSTSTKQSQVQTQLQLASSNTDHFHYCYTYTSIANNPASYAATMNPATVSIINTLSGTLCYVYADYMGSQSNGGAALLSAIIAQNYKYVFSGRSRVE